MENDIAQATAIIVAAIINKGTKVTHGEDSKNYYNRFEHGCDIEFFGGSQIRLIDKNDKYMYLDDLIKSVASTLKEI